MNTQNYSTDPNVPNQQPRPAPPERGQMYKFTKEELRVIKECNNDAFFRRCLPIGSLMAMGTLYGVRSGYLKPSPKWGPIPKVIVASMIGYFIGKISYHSTCVERIMQMPNSRLGAILRERKRGNAFPESLEPGYGTGISLGPFSNVDSSDVYSDIETPNNDYIDTTRPDQHELDDYQRPTIDNNPVFEEETMPVQQNKTTSYEELRLQNREAYQKQRTSVYKDLLPSEEAPSVRRASSEKDSLPTPSVPKRTNIYGDSME